MFGVVGEDVFHQVAAVLFIAAAIGAVATLLRQPLIVAFIAVGIVVGPAGLGIVEAGPTLELLADLGIALLLFVVGLKLDVALIRTTGPVALATGLGQVGFTSGVGFLLALALGMDVVTAAYVAVALTFSSTIIIVKLLSDKREIDQLHGRIAVGFLIVQDIVVVIALIALTAIGATGEGAIAAEIAWVLVKGVAMVAGIALLTRYVMTFLLHRLARSAELLVLAAIAWAVTLASGAEVLGFSEEVGAFLAGVSMASTPFRDAIGARLLGLRDFLLLFFFISLGAQFDVAAATGQLAPATVLSLFVLVGNPIIVMVIMGAMGYTKRTGFLAGLTVAQISEFSLILAALGLSLGHIDRDALGLVTMVGLITIGLSTYLILYSHPLYARIGHLLTVFERAHPRHGESDDPGTERAEVIVVGLGRFGGSLVEGLRRLGVRVLGVEFDPTLLDAWADRGVPVVYGDAEDPELPGHLPLDGVRWVVTTFPALDANLALLHGLEAYGYQGRVALTAHTDSDAELFAAAGADRVLTPFRDAGQVAAGLLAELAD